MYLKKIKVKLKTMKEKNFFKYLLLGCALGTIVFIEPAILFPGFIALNIVLFIQTRPEEDRSNLTKIVFTAFIFRLVFFFITIAYLYFSTLNIFEHPILGRIIGLSVQLFRDFYREIFNGSLLAKYFRGEFGYVAHLNEISFQGYGRLHFGAFFQGALNYLFGESIFNLFSFPVISLWIVILTYYLAKEIFDKYVAVSSSLVIAILPSFNLWACSNIRMTIGILGMLAMVYCLTLFYKNNKVGILIPLFVSAFIFTVAKEKIMKPTLLIIPLTLLLGLNLKLRRKIIFLLGLIAMAILIDIATKGIFRYKIKNLFVDLISTQTGFAGESPRHYKIYDEFIYHADLTKIPSLTSFIRIILKALPKGIFYFLFAPFPWDVDRILQLYSYPQMIFWYFMFGFSLFGVGKAVLEKKSSALPMVYVTAFFIIIFALVLGNVGIAARYRDLVSPFFYIFACSALCRLFVFSKEVENSRTDESSLIKYAGSV